MNNYVPVTFFSCEIEYALHFSNLINGTKCCMTLNVGVEVNLGFSLIIIVYA